MGIFVEAPDGDTASMRIASILVATVLVTTVLVPTGMSEAQAATYYVDADDGSDTSPGTSDALPWRTLGKVSAATIVPGDTVLFRRGRTFRGSLVVAPAEPGGARMTYGAYGEGAKPILSGWITLPASGFTSVGAGIWETDCAACGPVVNVVMLDSVMMAMGREPNAGSPNAGYRTIQSHAGVGSLTDATLGTGPNWTGGEVVIRKINYILDRYPITSHTGSTLSFTNGTGSAPIDGAGYFVQSHPSTLDVAGEWFFDTATRKLRVHFGSGQPSASVVQVGVIDTVVSAPSRRNVTIDGLAIQGATVFGVHAGNSTGVHVKNCEIRFVGDTAVYAPAADGFVLENSVIERSNHKAVDLSTEVTNARVSRNVIRDTALFQGMGGNGDAQHLAIYVWGDHNVVEGNRIERTGYIGIHFQGNDVVVRNNFIDGFDLIKEDGGGIYTYGGYPDPAVSYSARTVIDNIVLHGISAPEGTVQGIGNGWSHGIYLDENTKNVSVSGNTVAYNDGAGIFLNASHEVTLANNTAFGNREQMWMTSNDKTLARNITLTDNVLFSSTMAQPSLLLYSDARDDFGAFGTFARNRHARPLGNDSTLVTRFSLQGALEGFTLPRWQARYLHDATSRGNSVTVAP